MLPFDSIFFDSEPLIAAHWPTVATPLRSILRFAHRFEVALFLPEATERELEEHRLRDYDEISEEAISKAERLNRVFPYVEIPPFRAILPDRETVRQRYRGAVEDIKRDWAIQSIPLTNRNIEEAFSMAVRRQPPFKNEGAGFQDYIIFVSVVDYLSATGQTGAFVTRDGTIQKHKAMLTEFADASGAKVTIYESVAELEREFEKALDEEIRALMEHERHEVTNRLERMLAEIGQFIQENVDPDDWNAYQGKVLEIRKIEVLRIEFVLTDLGRNNEPTSISFQAVIKACVLIERSPFDMAILLGLKSVAESLVGQEEIELEKRLEVEARGFKANGDYDRIELVSASFKSY